MDDSSTVEKNISNTDKDNTNQHKEAEKILLVDEIKAEERNGDEDVPIEVSSLKNVY